ncbi:MAG: 50S ribosomal protein L13 [Candidatus Peribacteria bacterium]|jgi:large subunit ribosomal protein L13|nr:50S ribosomal protein L13 [Candidatus Peribacteria bacterium]
MEFTSKDLNKTIWVKQTDQEKNRLRYKVDASGKTLGRLAVDISKKLIGKDKSYYSDFWDAGSFVIVENADKIAVSGNKLQDKVYYSYSGYKGNLKSITLGELLKKNPSKALRYAVRGMLPKNKLRDARMKRLKVAKEATAKYDNFKPINLYK